MRVPLGSNAIADVINRSSNLSIIDLSNNDITQDGFMAIRDAVRCNKRITKYVLLPQSSYPPSDGSRPDDNIEEMVEEIDSYCDRNKSEVKYDEIDEILNGVCTYRLFMYIKIWLIQLNLIVSVMFFWGSTYEATFPSIARLT